MRSYLARRRRQTNAAGQEAGRIARRRRAAPAPPLFCHRVRGGRATSLADVARQLDVSPATLRRWVRRGSCRCATASWTPAALAQARIVARLRARGHTLDAVRAAAKEGPARVRLYGGHVPAVEASTRSADAARETGLEPELIRRIWTAAGFPRRSLDRTRRGRPRAAAHVAAVLTPGCRWWPSCSSCACTGRRWRRSPTPRCKLFHLYVHEPMIRDGAPVSRSPRRCRTSRAS